ncbi:MAG: hypothetical protein CMG74_12890 [Candidatus Marinimicrobia bacterium]|nr:hypothetical protein [Candidatus Neomarinimicrobiota bacterium]|tara:strand:- start:2642 stop:3805 length:1164 start_codon:yes stop_codon:yes gene_type:complete
MIDHKKNIVSSLILLIDGPTKWILGIGLSIRIIVFIILGLYPVPEVGRGPVGPMVYQTSADLDYYLQAVDIIKGEGSSRSRFLNTYKKILSNKPITDAERYAGPLYPLILIIFNYNISNVFPLSIFAFLIALLIYCAWQLWLIKKLGYYLSIPFIFLFQITWFGIFITPDIFFFLFCSYIYFLISSNHLWYTKIPFWIAIILTAALRPNALAIILFCLIILLRNEFSIDKYSKLAFGLLLILFSICLFYYSPYGIIENRISHDSYIYVQKINETFNTSSVYINKIINIISLSIIKFLWTFGIHPSSSGLAIAVLYRFLTGCLFIVGFIYCLIKKNVDSFYIFLLIVPIMLFFPPGWRHILPAIPILYYYGMIALNNYNISFNKLRKI